MSDPDRLKPITRRYTPEPEEGRAVARSNPGHGTARPVATVGACRRVVVSGSRRDRVTAVAAVQHGVVSRDQLRAAGVSDGAVTGMVARGELVRVYRGVYRLSPVVHVPLAREVAALLACGPEAVLSHRTAADLWALPVALSRGCTSSAGLMARSPSA